MLDSTVFDFPAKKVCLHLLHVEKDWVEIFAVHKLFNNGGAFGPSFQTIFPFLMTDGIKDYMTCKLKSVLKIRNKGIPGLPLQNFFPVTLLLHNIFRDLDVKETQSPYQIRLIFKYLTYKFADTSKQLLEVYFVFIRLLQGKL